MKLPVFRYLLVKLASRCNLNCTYCYWFRDATVYDTPPILTSEVEHAFLRKLESHVVAHELDYFSLLFHGGEPLLFGKRRFARLLSDLLKIEKRTGCAFKLSVTTNGTMIDEQWAKLLRVANVAVTLSVDGPKVIHDKARVDHAGRGSHDNVIHGLSELRHAGIEPGVLAVCDPRSDPQTITTYFVNTLGIKHFDILMPDFNHNDSPLSIAPYYKRLFDLWYDDYSRRGVDVRTVRAMVKSLLGGDSAMESVGYGPILTVTMLTDGALEPLDVLRIAGSGATRSKRNILDHTFQDVTTDSVWLEAFRASLNLCQTCRTCVYRQACGGGYLPQRWSTERRYDNPSVYCEDLKEIYGYIWSRIAPEVEVVVNGRAIPLLEALSAPSSPPATRAETAV